MKLHGTKLIASTSIVLVAACAGGGHSNETPLTAAEACATLVGLEVPAAEIALPTHGAKVANAKLVAASEAAPEHCLVAGTIASVDAAAQPIKFSFALPSDWNGKLMHHGGSGLNGSVPDPTLAGARTSGPSSLQRGYVVIGSDSGHTGTGTLPSLDGSFIANAEQLRNFGGDELKKTRDTAVTLIRKRYGKNPGTTYFMGGSEGGREGFVVVQRFPQDYDGVFSLFPVFNLLPGYSKWQMVSRALRLNNGAGWLNAEKLELLRKSELAACDTLDGAADQLISNVAACSFDVNTLLCPGGGDAGNACLSQAQANTVRTMYENANLPYALANGYTLIPGYFPGTIWTNLLGTSPVYTREGDAAGLGFYGLFADVYSRWMANRGGAVDTMSVNPMAPGGASIANLQAFSAATDMTSTDISAFIARGGKWIIAHGLSDPLPVASGTMAYYKELVGKYGQANLDRMLRFYTIPGYAHGSGAFNATGGMPVVEALEAWVERGISPGTLVVTDTNPGASRARPMCVYPAWPKYKGTGSLSDASNFDCVMQ